MRIFYQMTFDTYVLGTSNVYSDPNLNALLGSVDQLAIGGYTAQVTAGAGSPTLAIQVEHSFDNTRWQSRNVAAEVSTTLSTTGETNFSGQDGDPGSRPTLAFARLRISLGGTSPAGQVRVWVTGRDRAEV